ncbi:two-component sensor kinase TcrY domain protein [Mycobacterium ulcerans str. Harvey]|uniref:Two-component sensor kinase TcrY domain protein n=1 Tax=Mycobacterium ulcerans str. Harvey TaxID=1299332 RepID=A0ABN0QP79_MYCUL|nr:two-component sensor kinase TcrY domain protein [Mycobacterium ulcerans str. Harvey]
MVRDGKAIVAGYLTNRWDRAEISPTAQAQLAAVAGGQDPVTLNLDGLGRYRWCPP